MFKPPLGSMASKFNKLPTLLALLLLAGAPGVPEEALLPPRSCKSEASTVPEAGGKFICCCSCCWGCCCCCCCCCCCWFRMLPRLRLCKMLPIAACCTAALVDTMGVLNFGGTCTLPATAADETPALPACTPPALRAPAPRALPRREPALPLLPAAAAPRAPRFAATPLREPAAEALVVVPFRLVGAPLRPPPAVAAVEEEEEAAAAVVVVAAAAAAADEEEDLAAGPRFLRLAWPFCCFFEVFLRVSECTRLAWRRRALAWRKAWPQSPTEQTNGFSPVCWYLWYWK